MKNAFDLDGKLVLAKNATNKERYVCPRCAKRLLVCKGELCQPYFRHISELDGRSSGGGETILHQRVKNQIIEMSKKNGMVVHSEYVVKSVGRRVDVLVENEFGKLAVEIQCSPITKKELLQRKRDYETLGFRSWWIAGPHYLNIKSLRSTALKFGKKSPSGFTFFGIDTKGKYWMFSEFRITAMGRNLYRKRKIILDWNQIVNLNHEFRKLKNGLTTNSLIDDINWIKKCLFGKHLNLQFVSFQKWLYEHGKNLEGSPWIAHFPRETLSIEEVGIPFLERIRVIQLLQDAHPDECITLYVEREDAFKRILLQARYIKEDNGDFFRTGKDFKWYQDSHKKIKDVCEIARLMKYGNEL